jgi:uncharacterized protein YndB with AHSA1/START domain
MTATQPAPLQLRLERVIRADRQRVWDAWTRPEILRQWSAPEGLRGGDGTMDLRVGGGWSFRMTEPDGTWHEAFGTYREIAPPRRIVYTHAWRGADGGGSPETLLSVDLHPDGDGTRLVLTQSGFASPESRDGHVEGWSSALDQLAAMFQGSLSHV